MRYSGVGEAGEYSSVGVKFLRRLERGRCEWVVKADVIGREWFKFIGVQHERRWRQVGPGSQPFPEPEMGHNAGVSNLRRDVCTSIPSWSDPVNACPRGPM